MKASFFLSVCFFAIVSSARAQVGVGTLSPNSTLDIRGSLATSYRAFSGSTSVSDSDHTLVFTGGSAATATLPSAATCAGRSYTIRNIAAGLPVPPLTIGTTASQTIDGQPDWTLDEPGELVKITSSGAEWIVSEQGMANGKTTAVGGMWTQGGNYTTSAKALGTQSNVDLPFMTNSTEQMRLTAGGNLGIGTTDPTHKLELIASSDPLLLGGVQNGASTDSLLVIENGVVKKIAQSALPSAPTNVWSTNGNSGLSPATNFMGTTVSTSLRFRTDNVQRMIIDSIGNIGIGTSTPGSLVEINTGTAGASGLRLSQVPLGAVLYANASGDMVQNTNALYVDATNSRLSAGAGTSPNSTLSVGGSVSLPVVTKSSSYTLTADNYSVLCNSTTGGFTVTLPGASGCAGRVYVVKKVSGDGSLITIHASGTDNIDGASNQYIYAPYSYFTIQSDGASSWSIIAQH